jgi:voltage-gated potassium channel
MSVAARQRVADLLDERGSAPGRAFVTAVLLLAIVAALIFSLLMTLPDLDGETRRRLLWLGGAAAVVFSIEYPLRLWIAPVRRHYALSFLGAVDLLTSCRSGCTSP